MSSSCCFNVSPALTQWRMLFLYSQCVCVELMSPLMNLIPHNLADPWFVTVKHRFNHVNEAERKTAFHETIPSKVINANSKIPIRGRLMGAICHCLASLVEQASLYHVCQSRGNVSTVQNIYDSLNWIMQLKQATQVGASGQVFWCLILAPALWTYVDDSFFPKG